MKIWYMINKQIRDLKKNLQLDLFLLKVRTRLWGKTLAVWGGECQSLSPLAHRCVLHFPFGEMPNQHLPPPAPTQPPLTPLTPQLSFSAL